MADTQASRKIDPELLRQLNAVAADNEPVEAVVRLNPDNPAEIVPSPEHFFRSVTVETNHACLRLGRY